MKNFFKSVLALVSFMMIASCEDVEPTIYNGNESGTFLGFTSTTYTLPVVIDDQGSVVVTLNSSTTSSVDRVYNLDIIEEESTANPNTYVLPETLVIPANSFSGSITIQGMDNGLVDINAKPLVFEISNITDEYYDSKRVTVNVVEVCPLFDDFTGSYRVNQLTDGFPLQGGPYALFAENSIVQLVVGDSEYERYFIAVPYPDLTSVPQTEFRFNLVCASTMLSRELAMPFYCTEGNNVVIRESELNANYNPNDDTIIEVSFSEDATGSCGGPYLQTLRLTKVN